MDVSGIDRVYEQFELTLRVMRGLQVKDVRMTFTEAEMDEIVRLLGELKAIKEREADDLK